MDKNVTMKLFGTAMAIVTALVGVIWTMTVNGQEKGDANLQKQIDAQGIRIDSQYGTIMQELININRNLGYHINKTNVQ